jgi:hypothetical protein
VFVAMKKINHLKIFLLQEKFSLIFKKIYFFFSKKYFSEVMKKFRNIILFVDYIKFDP